MGREATERLVLIVWLAKQCKVVLHVLFLKGPGSLFISSKQQTRFDGVCSWELLENATYLTLKSTGCLNPIVTKDQKYKNTTISINGVTFYGRHTAQRQLLWSLNNLKRGSFGNTVCLQSWKTADSVWRDSGKCDMPVGCLYRVIGRLFLEQSATNYFGQFKYRLKILKINQSFVVHEMKKGE